ncbi:protein-L-isoaspartate(D-aspartate) O-methyltransferase [Aquabacter sediminis]|uniref:protein-L-isoaspartate(D-aspartate) O-methyltransferase n=1 Tax=Aquabacter sediminis TaxID=3029197 RepID=UPI00237EC3DC|nr:protein-L-isoaspartate(D-aspartate) O-methyltransferase [Aquabacter sp. P-9]MDE1567725.1 protein-L-isoaspartate(D-aspartate) O-methyltransferase [Aquabacter sp. P-9]
MTESEAEKRERAAFVLGLRHRGVQNVMVLRAMELVPRALFVDPALRPLAYLDVALPIACGQTMSQPTVVATMTEALAVNAAHRVLEVGTGSGYHAAVLSQLASEVVTLDRYRGLVAEAQVRFGVLSLHNVAAFHADGRAGLAVRAPYDRILVTAAVRSVPEALVAQLRPEGVLVAPVGDADSVQTLTRFVKTPSGLAGSALMAVRFAPLTPGVAGQL